MKKLLLTTALILTLCTSAFADYVLTATITGKTGKTIVMHGSEVQGIYTAARPCFKAATEKADKAEYAWKQMSGKVTREENTITMVYAISGVRAEDVVTFLCILE